MDYDKTAQSYGPGGPVACPSGVNCEYDNAFGLGIIGTEEPDKKDAGDRIFQAGGGSERPGSVEGKTMDAVSKEWVMLANLIEAAGPNLTPDTMWAQGPSMGSAGGPGTPNELVQFDGSSGYWTKDQRLIYFSRNVTSNYNGLPGGYVQVGDRITLGNYATKPSGEPDIPVKR